MSTSGWWSALRSDVVDADRCGVDSRYVSPRTGTTYPKIQIMTVGELLDGKKRARMPTAILSYVKAKARASEQPSLGL